MSHESDEDVTEGEKDNLSTKYQIVVEDVSLEISEEESEFEEPELYQQHLSHDHEVVQGLFYNVKIELSNKSDGVFPGGSSEFRLTEFTPGMSKLERVYDSPDIDQLSDNEETTIEIEAGYFYFDSGFELEFDIAPNDGGSILLFDGELDGPKYEDEFLKVFSVINRMEISALNKLEEICNKLEGS